MSHTKIILRKANNYSGQLGAGTRRVIITGTANVGSLGIVGSSGAENSLKSRFAAQGWNIVNFHVGITGVFTYAATINITADVPNAYANQSHLDQAYRIFNGYEISSGIKTWNPFTGVYLEIQGEDKADFKPPKSTTIKGTPTPTPGGNNSNGNPNGNPNPLDFLNPTNLFGTAGLSVGLVAAVLIGIIILKR